jgi:amino acid transporter
MAAPLIRWVIALLIASLAMGLVLAHAAYAGPRAGVATASVEWVHLQYIAYA